MPKFNFNIKYQLLSEQSRAYQEQVCYEEFRAQFINQYQGKEPTLTPELIEKIKILEKFSPDKKRFFVLFSHKQFYPIYISENVEAAGGYTLKEIYDGGLLFMFKHIHWKQLSSIIQVVRWGKRYANFVANRVSGINQNTYHCGAKFKDKWKNWRTIFIKQKILLTNKDNYPLLSFLEVEEISSIYKGDFQWMRLSSSNEYTTFTRAYFSNKSKKEYADVLSSREIELLKLITAKKTTSEISELLNITKETILKHRKNMIARVGVKDMTGLIYICRLCQLI